MTASEIDKAIADLDRDAAFASGLLYGCLGTLAMVCLGFALLWLTL